jgi:hypothetical protein
MKKSLLVLSICFFASFGAFSQKVYLADTAFTTDVGFGGAPASCIAPHTYYFGWQMGRAQNTWLADQFVVPADSTWIFDTVIVYGFQKGSSTTSPFMNCNLQIYSGTPGLGGNVIWGDTSTNVLTSTGFTGIYRVDTLITDGGLMRTQNPIMYLKLYLSPAPRLSGGTYWLSWSSATSLPGIPSSPDKVLPGRINPPGQVSRQLFGGVWYNTKDSGNAIGMNMIIKASAAAMALVKVPDVNSPLQSFLSENIPNPFTAFTDISFYMPQQGYAKLSVYNSIGQQVATLVDGDIASGSHKVVFNPGNLPAGLYYYQLRINSGTYSRQMICIK